MTYYKDLERKEMKLIIEKIDSMPDSLRKNTPSIFFSEVYLYIDVYLFIFNGLAYNISERIKEK